MPLITRRDEALEYHNHFRNAGACMAIFCTAAHWNTEAILVAAQRFGEQHNLHQVPVAVAMTFTYPFMPQGERFTYARNAPIGFLSNMGHLRALCDGPNTPYDRVVVLPHLDHADPTRDRWALTEGVPHLATVMFDAQKYPFEQNLAWTQEYVQSFGKEVLVEGIIEELSVGDLKKAVQRDDYVEKAARFMEQTGADLLVADLGTEQQSDHVGEVRYLKERAQALTASLGGDARLVLHGTSSLSIEQMRNLADDGVVRINMWTRIVREAGQFAGLRLVERADAVRAGNFEATESRQYLDDSIEAAAQIMIDVMDSIGYARLAT
jgi:fructose/tagatose bisphosphate aldolase